MCTWLERFTLNRFLVSSTLRPWQTRSNCCVHNTFLYLLTRATFVANHKNASDFILSETFCVISNKYFQFCAAGRTENVCFVSRSFAHGNNIIATICPQKRVLVFQGFYSPGKKIKVTSSRARLSYLYARFALNYELSIRLDTINMRE